MLRICESYPLPADCGLHILIFWKKFLLMSDICIRILYAGGHTNQTASYCCHRISCKVRSGWPLPSQHFAPLTFPYTEIWLSCSSKEIAGERETAATNQTSCCSCTVQYGTVRYSTVRYGTVRYGTVQYGTVRYSTVRYGTVRYSTVRYGTVQYSTVRYGTVQYGTVRYSTVRYSTVRYGTVR
jgi:hypothetical protein